MSQVQHRSIGENTRTAEQAEAAKEEKKKELIERYVITPWRSYRIDQLSVWVLWFTAAASLFLFCTVSAVALAIR